MSIVTTNPRRRRPPKNAIGAFQPDLWGGAGKQRPQFGKGERAQELAQARREMMDAGSLTLFDVSPKRTRRNLDAYMDEHGIHPLRYSEGYEHTKVGEKPLTPTQDFDQVAKRWRYADRKEQQERQQRAARDLAEIRERKRELKAQLADVREALKHTSAAELGIHVPDWMRGWTAEEVADAAEREQGRRATESDWDAGISKRYAAEQRQRDRSRGSARQQLQRQADSIRQEIAEMDRLLATTTRKNPRGARVVYNRLLGAWYVVVGPHQTPIGGAFPSRAAALASIKRRNPTPLRKASDWLLFSTAFLRSVPKDAGRAARAQALKLASRVWRGERTNPGDGGVVKDYRKLGDAEVIWLAQLGNEKAIAEARRRGLNTRKKGDEREGVYWTRRRNPSLPCGTCQSAIEIPPRKRVVSCSKCGCTWDVQR